MNEGSDLEGVSCLVFDFFGTLVDYSPSRTAQGYRRTHALYRSTGGSLDYPAFLACWSAAFAELDEATAASRREYSMDEAVRVFRRRAAASTRPDVLAELAASYLDEWSRDVRPIDGVAPMLERLAADFTLAIVTNTHSADLVPAQLRRLGVHRLFDAVVTSVGFGLRKPSPSIFEFALEALAAAPGECLYIGDSYEPDFEGPRSVGIRPLLIDPLGTAPVAPRDRIGSILELEARLASR